jgi:hypothetical protein
MAILRRRSILFSPWIEAIVIRVKLEGPKEPERPIYLSQCRPGWKGEWGT